MALTRLPGSKWWIETDDITFEIIGTYNKAVISADIDAIQETLATLPNPTRDESDVADVIALLSNITNATKRARIDALIRTMYEAYNGTPLKVETAQLIARLETLKILRARLV
jgi:hypothetical protein